MTQSIIDIGLDNIWQNRQYHNEAAERIQEHTGELMPMASWTVISKKRILLHFRQSLAFERVDIFLKENAELLPNEKVILFWLAKVYGESMNTVELYCNYVVRFINYAQKDFHHVTYIDIDAFLRHLSAQNMKPNTINTIGATLKSFFRTMTDARFMEYNPTSFIKKAKKAHKATVQGHLQHSLSSDEMKTLLDYMKEHAPIRDYIIVHILYTTGLRAVELCSLRWEDLVEWQGAWYFHVIGKGSKARRVYVPKISMNELMHFRQTVFCMPPYMPAPHLELLPIVSSMRNVKNHITRHSIFRIVRTWVELGLGKNVSPHWLRHTCFTQLRLRGATIEAIQASAGHSSIETTMQYNEAAALMKPAGKVFDEDL
ncbi:MAG: tyrosine-type recombinase/integrase [Pseudomonadota bacterium]